MEKTFPQQSVSRKVLQVLIITAITLSILHIGLKFISIVLFDEKHGFLFELANRMDMNDENSVPQWFSQAIFLLIAASALLAARLQQKPPARRLWIAMAVIGVLLSLDDVATLHEFALQMLHNTYYLDTTSTLFVNTWWILLPFVLLVAAILAWFGYKLLPRRTLWLLLLGGTVYVLGKVLADSFANDVHDLFLNQGVTQGVEKLFQYTGSALVVYANFDYLERFHVSKIRKALAQLK